MARKGLYSRIVNVGGSIDPNVDDKMKNKKGGFKKKKKK